MNYAIRLLIVEDSDSDLQLILAQLMRGGFTVDYRRVQDEREMAEALDDGPWNIVITDYSLPRFSGLEALRMLRERDVDTPALVVSGTIGEETAVAAMRAGAQDYLLKDQLSRLGSAVRRELDDAAARLDRRRVFDELRRSEQRFRLLVETVRDHAIFMLDRTGAILTWPAAAAEITGYDEFEMTGVNQAVLFTSEDRDIGRPDALLVQAAIDGTAEDDGRRVRKDGTLFWANAVVTALAEEDGEVTGYVEILRDTTERHELERRLLQSQKLESLGRLSGGIAHDFNNILTAIMANADLGLSSVPDDHEAVEYFNGVIRSAGRAAALIQQLLAFSRQPLANPRPIAVDEAIGDISDMLHRIIGEDIVLQLDLNGGPFVAEVDPTQFSQVIMNLAVNARDAMSNGGELAIAVRAEMSGLSSAPVLAGLDPGPYVVVSVTDTGEGMDEQTQARVFEPFFTTKDSARGTGLGLPTCYGIVRAARGHIEFESTLGEGTTFRVYLPAASSEERAQVEAAANGTPAAATTTVRGRVVFVEDNEDIRRLSTNLLNAAGYSVLAFDTAEAALDAIQPGAAVDALCTDSILPGINGRELVRQMRLRIPGLPAVVMSGYSPDLATPGWSRDDHVTFLPKPFSGEALVRALASVMTAAS